MTWAALIPMAVQLGTSLMANRGRSASSEIPTLKPQLDALEAARVYEEAAINPASPHFKALQALQEAEIKRNVLKALDQLTRQQNRSRARGVMGLIANPERRDESIAGAIGNMFAESGDQASKGARSTLETAAGSARGRAGGYGSINNMFQGYADTNNASRVNSLQAFGNLFQTQGMQDVLSKIFGGSAPMSSMPTSIDISGPAGALTVGDVMKTQFVSK